MRWTVGGNCVDYSGNVSTKTADLSTIKILFNSIIFTAPYANCMMEDLIDFNLGTPMEPKDYTYMCMFIPVTMLPTASLTTTSSTL